MNLTCCKRFGPFPFAHRQPSHDGHCALVHGHNWTFEVEFTADHLDSNGFVIDFGRMQFLKNWMNEMFDHTLVLPKTDPHFEYFSNMAERGLAKVTWLDSVSAEGLARYLLTQIKFILAENTNGRVSVRRVTVFEDEKNSASVMV